jgi:ribosome-associated protein
VKPAPVKREVKKAPKAIEPTWLTAVRAAEEKKALEIRVLDLTGVSSFTDYFVICTGSSTRQNQAISDEVAMRMKKRGELPLSVEGYGQAEWVLTDYGDVVIHALTPKARAYYDLERLWRDGKSVAIPAEVPVGKARTAKSTPAPGSTTSA